MIKEKQYYAYPHLGTASINLSGDIEDIDAIWNIIHQFDNEGFCLYSRQCKHCYDDVYHAHCKKTFIKYVSKLIKQEDE